MNPGRGREWLLASLPHQGAMNLIESVVDWDDARLNARASNHRDARNPLRRGAMLSAMAGIEYGAQAAAAHGALIGQAGAGMIASVRSVRFHVDRLDDAGEVLAIHAEQLGGGAGGVLYRFEVSSEGRVLVEGRVTVAFAR